MNLFRLFRKRPSITIHDPAFGTITYDSGLWSGEAAIPAAGEWVQVLVRAGEQGPTEAQREFWSQARTRYREHQEEIVGRAMEWAREFCTSNDWNPPIKPSDFTLDSVTIEATESGPAKWSLSFGWEGDPEWCLEIHLEDWQIVDTGVAH